MSRARVRSARTRCRPARACSSRPSATSVDEIVEQQGLLAAWRRVVEQRCGLVGHGDGLLPGATEIHVGPRRVPRASDGTAKSPRRDGIARYAQALCTAAAPAVRGGIRTGYCTVPRGGVSDAACRTGRRCDRPPASSVPSPPSAPSSSASARSLAARGRRAARRARAHRARPGGDRRALRAARPARARRPPPAAHERRAGRSAASCAAPRSARRPWRSSSTQGREALHYREWFDLLAQPGHEIAGKDPLAVFLTQISRSPVVRKGDARRASTSSTARRRTRLQHTLDAAHGPARPHGDRNARPRRDPRPPQAADDRHRAGRAGARGGGKAARPDASAAPRAIIEPHMAPGSIDVRPAQAR